MLLSYSRDMTDSEHYTQILLEEIREIRASERRFYQKITDIYALAMNYDPDASVTKEFFAMVQNKMHYAIHQHTAAELIIERADAEKPYMGLTTWKERLEVKFSRPMYQSPKII